MQVLLFSSSRVIIYTRVISINKRLCPSSSSITLFQLGIILNSCHYYIFLICFTIVEPNSRDNKKRDLRSRSQFSSCVFLCQNEVSVPVFVAHLISVSL